ncbi:4594_t:CDS:2 [Cetraspora pellucida]|uniref:4594_t:CDS:1 n=1 Tax=Cetraspora pellucida TaxID=1433469 RepID=A0A9N9DYD2_9GLOM|nr:4594_t:CDS:2 [Cetraspora pellucida]
MAETLFNKVTSVDSNEFFENESVGIYFECNITLDNFINIEDDPHEISRKITNLVGDIDGYYYIYSNNLKHQRDRESMERFDCDGTLQITLNIITNSASIYLKHETLHRRPERNRVTEEIKNYIKKNIHLTSSDIYHALELNSTELTQKQVHILLEESTYQIIMFNNDNGIKLLGFITPFFEKLKKNQEIFIDATHKTNTLGYQLYLVIGQYDGAASQQTCIQSLINTDMVLSNNILDNSLLDVLNDITANVNDNSNQLFEKYNSILQDALLIVQEQQEINNFK